MKGAEDREDEAQISISNRIQSDGKEIKVDKSEEEGEQDGGQIIISLLEKRPRTKRYSKIT